MKLYCQKCNENHEFSAVDVERLVYGLQAELAESLIDDHGDSELIHFYGQFKGKDCDEATMCLKEHDALTGDSEAYGEHTAQLVKTRREKQGVGRCDNCGADAPTNVDECDLCRRAVPRIPVVTEMIQQHVPSCPNPHCDNGIIRGTNGVGCSICKRPIPMNRWLNNQESQ